MSIPAIFLLTTTLAGLSLLFSSFIYLAAAFVGEKWIPIKITDRESRSPIKISEPPSRVPPRGPAETLNKTSNDHCINDKNSTNPTVEATRNNESMSVPKPSPRPLPSIHSDIEVHKYGNPIGESPSRPPPRRPPQSPDDATIRVEQSIAEMPENRM
ncbi:uncharacterized protein TRIADDRAFT_52448 [Trichoplax adhaerens]|uniref:Cytochrome b-245 light chain n=1 Tax=Trichoplax adhaerens TaxID=10228 RepID=B3RIL5_TRIAD|nr:predicted protein [Trichoplax adhaerens]EDV29739.1 predicted protein [Trichoplax adhaerens]|eukprot:XP_002108941.1 predicted protein [Trichoplax adhaerens]